MPGKERDTSLLHTGRGTAAVPMLRPGHAGVPGPLKRGAGSTGQPGMQATLTEPKGQSPPGAEAEVQAGQSCLPAKAQRLWGQFFF